MFSLKNLFRSSVTAVAGAHNIRQNEASQQKVGATFSHGYMLTISI